jgi:hypothetical protein
MQKSRPPLSIDARQLGRHGVHSLANANIARDSPMSPESEDSFSVASPDSPYSQRSFGINSEPLPAHFTSDVLRSPDDQEDSQMDDAERSEGESMSPQSQASFGITSMPLPGYPDHHTLPEVRIMEAQNEETGLPPVLVEASGAGERDVSTSPAQIEDLIVDSTQPTEHVGCFINPSASPGTLGIGPALFPAQPTGAEVITENLPAASGKFVIADYKMLLILLIQTGNGESPHHRRTRRWRRGK